MCANITGWYVSKKHNCKGGNVFRKFQEGVKIGWRDIDVTGLVPIPHSVCMAYINVIWG